MANSNLSLTIKEATDKDFEPWRKKGNQEKIGNRKKNLTYQEN